MSSALLTIETFSIYSFFYSIITFRAGLFSLVILLDWTTGFDGVEVILCYFFNPILILLRSTSILGYYFWIVLKLRLIVSLGFSEVARGALLLLRSASLCFNYSFWARISFFNVTTAYSSFFIIDSIWLEFCFSCS